MANFTRTNFFIYVAVERSQEILMWYIKTLALTFENWLFSLNFSTICQTKRSSSPDKQEAHGLHRSPEKPVHINENIWIKQWFYIYHGIGPVVLKKTILKFCQCNFPLLLLSPFGNKHGTSFKQTWIPFTKGCYVPRLVEIGPLVLEKIIEICQCIFTISYL